MTIAKLWVIIKPKNRGIFKETFATSEKKAWDEFYLGGVCKDAIDDQKDPYKLGYRARKVEIVI